MGQKSLLVKAYEFISHSSVFDLESPIDWCSRLNRLYDRGWLYGCFHGERMIALAGAYRIPEWRENDRERIPDEEYGPCLYISFFVSTCERLTDPLRLLRDYLKEHPEIREVLYWEKYSRHGRQMREPFLHKESPSIPGRLKRWRITHLHPARFDERFSYARRIGVLPPEFTAIR